MFTVVSLSLPILIHTVLLVDVSYLRWQLVAISFPLAEITALRNGAVHFIEQRKLSFLTASFSCDNHRPNRDVPVQLQGNLLQTLWLAEFFKCKEK